MTRLDNFVQMIKRTAVTSSCNGRWRNRRSSAIRTLVAETLVLAKTHGYVEKIEDELERELQRDFSDPPQEKILRWRRTGDKIFKSKHMLLAVVILCILDCGLVLGELALDLYKVKATLEDSEIMVKTTEIFISEMSDQHPTLYNKNPSEIFSMIMNATVIWTSLINVTRAMNVSSAPYVKCNTPDMTSDTTSSNVTSFIAPPIESSHLSGHMTSAQHYDVDDIVGKIAQVFHYCSLGILTLVLIQTILKGICAGRSFFRRKIEVFDAFVVMMSFLMDFSFVVFLHEIDTKDFVFILAILLPWRVIRVVDSLVVAVKDHEHFRLKLVYKRKKKIQGNLRDAEVMLQKYISQATALKRLCIMEGIEEWKIDKYLKNEDSVPPTPQKKKFKFKLDESLFHGHNRAPRCSMPALDFHGVKLPSSKSKMSFASVSNSIKHHISKTLQSKRSPLASSDSISSHVSNGDIKRRKKRASEDLCTMHEEESENEDSIVSSRATSESGDVFSRISISGSLGSERVCNVPKASFSRHNSETTDDDVLKMVLLKEDAHRRHSESFINKGNKSVNLSDLVNTISFTSPNGKVITKPYRPCDSSTDANFIPVLEKMNLAHESDIDLQTKSNIDTHDKSDVIKEVEQTITNNEDTCVSDTNEVVTNVCLDKSDANVENDEDNDVDINVGANVNSDLCSPRKILPGPLPNVTPDVLSDGVLSKSDTPHEYSDNNISFTNSCKTTKATDNTVPHNLTDATSEKCTDKSKISPVTGKTKSHFSDAFNEQFIGIGRKTPVTEKTKLHFSDATYEQFTGIGRKYPGTENTKSHFSDATNEQFTGIGRKFPGTDNTKRHLTDVPSEQCTGISKKDPVIKNNNEVKQSNGVILNDEESDVEKSTVIGSLPARDIVFIVSEVPNGVMRRHDTT